MNETSPTSSIFFLHIPKTAGSSLISFIEDNICLSDVLMFHRVREIFSATRYLDDIILKNSFFVGGHMPPSLAKNMQQPVKMVTMLREPVALVISTFEHYKRDGLIAADMNIDEFINSPEGSILSNIQTRWIAEFNIPGFSLNLNELSQRNNIVTEEVFQIAINNLKLYDHVGVSEKFSQTIDCLRKILEFNTYTPIAILNSGNYNKEISPTTLELITKICSYDIRLYDFAFNVNSNFCKLFQENIEEKSKIPPDLDRRAFIDMDDSLKLKGFHRRELWPDWSGVRWSSSFAEIQMDMHIIPNVEYVFKMFSVNVIKSENIHQVEIFIEDINLNLTSHKSYTSYKFSASFRTDKLLAYPKIRIKVPFALKPIDYSFFNSDDSRELGIAVKWLYIGPIDDYIENNQ